jgi:hypothetical protein
MKYLKDMGSIGFNNVKTAVEIIVKPGKICMRGCFIATDNNGKNG